MGTTTISRDFVSAERRTWMERARQFIEDAFKNVSPKPEVVRNMRYHNATPVFERHRVDYERLIAQGADVNIVLDGIYAIAMEFERRADLVPLVSLAEAHQELVEAECESNALQLRASRTGTLADCEAAERATVREVRLERRYANMLIERMSTIRALDSQVGYRRPLGAA